MAPPIKTDSALSSLPGYFQMRQPRAADMQPSAPQSSGFSSPSATESAFRVLASNPPDVTKSATFSTPAEPRPIAYAPVGGTFDPKQGLPKMPGPARPDAASDTSHWRMGGQTPATRFSQDTSKGSTQPPYASVGNNVPKGGTGGSGFVGFGQYFGANAPTAQVAEPVSSAPQNWTSGDAFNAMIGYGATQRQNAQEAAQAKQRAEQNKAAFVQQRAAAQTQRETRARSVAQQGRGPEAQQMREEEEPSGTQKQQSNRRGSRFDDYFSY